MPALPRPTAPILLLIAGLALAACAGGPPRTEFAPITFAHLPPIRLDVAEVSLEQAYRSPAEAPHVEHLFPTPPGEAALRWGRERLAAAGTTRRAEFVVREASVTETPLKGMGGLKGLVTTEQSERYDARVVIELRLLGDDGRVVGTATARAVRMRSVPEDITLGAREQVWHQMTQDLMRELNDQLEKTIKEVFVPYVVL